MEGRSAATQKGKSVKKGQRFGRPSDGQANEWNDGQKDGRSEKGKPNENVWRARGGTGRKELWHGEQREA